MDSSRPSRAHSAPTVVVELERECAHGWEYDVTIRQDESAASHTVTMSWRDHDYWCGGAQSPSRVVQAVVEYALANLTMPLPGRFDAAKVRRWLPRIDSELKMAM